MKKLFCLFGISIGESAPPHHQWNGPSQLEMATGSYIVLMFLPYSITDYVFSYS